MSNSIPLPDSSQDTDSAIVAMLNEMLAQDNLGIEGTFDGWCVVEYHSEYKDTWKTIDIRDTRAAAYRAAIDCLIEACIDAWDKAGEE